MGTEHHFNTDEAKKYGIEEAIIINNLRFWLLKNKANNTHVHDGYIWTYNSSRAFAELFPYMTANKIAKVLKKMEKLGIIKTGNYNKSGYDRTKWYSLPEFAIEQKGKIHSADLQNGLSQKVQAIPYNKTQIIKQDTSSSSKEETTASFSQEEWVLSLSTSEQPHIRLIAYYFGKYLEHNFPTKEVANEELKKNLKPAVFLTKNYEKKHISQALRYCQEKFADVHWNLHTVKKQISYVTAKKS